MSKQNWIFSFSFPCWKGLIPSLKSFLFTWCVKLSRHSFAEVRKDVLSPKNSYQRKQRQPSKDKTFISEQRIFNFLHSISWIYGSGGICCTDKFPYSKYITLWLLHQNEVFHYGFSKCEKICMKLKICSYVIKKALMENFIFCAVSKYKVCGNSPSIFN